MLATTFGDAATPGALHETEIATKTIARKNRMLLNSIRSFLVKHMGEYYIIAHYL
jgi:hypothetical protein